MNLRSRKSISIEQPELLSIKITQLTQVPSEYGSSYERILNTNHSFTELHKASLIIHTYVELYND